MNDIYLFIYYIFVHKAHRYIGGPTGGRITTGQRHLINNSWPASFGLWHVARCNWWKATSTRQTVNALAASRPVFLSTVICQLNAMFSQRNKRKFVDTDSYIYVLNNTNKDATIQYWTCERKTCCRAKVHVSNGRVVRQIGEHTRGPSVDEVTSIFVA